MTAHRHVRPRYGRLTAAVSSFSVTVVAVMAGFGLLPSAAQEPAPRGGGTALLTSAEREPARTGADDAADTAEPGAGERSASTPGERRRVTAADLLPADSGTGRRVVFSEGQQRVWIIGERGGVLHSHLVSGSLSDNLDPGTYQVYSRDENAVGIDDSGTMKYFVRFTQGDTGAAIGFHDIPIDEGERVQTVDELGTPTSHGCIRQKTSDAKAMWAFAGVGTTVVVTP